MAENNEHQNPTEIDGEEAEFILSLCWDAGVLSAVYYNLTTLELHVSIIAISLIL
jgi:hypothetical protein